MKVKHSVDLSAEAHYLSVFSGQVKDESQFFLEAAGTKERGREREVLEHKQRSTVLRDQFLVLEGMEVSRNGLYDLLPESLFHPLVLGRNAANTYEIIDEIRRNRVKESEDRLFFMPFDTELFLAKVELLKAELDLESKQDHVVQGLLQAIGLDSNDLTQKIASQLVLCLLQGQELKDRPEVLEKLLEAALESEVRLESHSPEISDYSSPVLGKTILSVDSVLAGPLQLEGEDWRIRIQSTDSNLLARAVTDPTLDAEIMALVECFAYAPRTIVISWEPKSEALTPMLGQARLGVNLSTTSIN